MILFEASWNDFEEGFHVIVREENEHLIMETDGHNVMQGDYRSVREVSQDEALEEMMELAEFEEE